MKITARTDAALRAMLALAETGGIGGVTAVSDLASGTGLPLPFLRQVLLALKHGGLVVSRGGSRGGYRLARPADRISVGEVVRAMQGDFAPMPCASPSGAEVCAASAACALRPLWARIQVATANIVDGVTLHQLVPS